MWRRLRAFGRQCITEGSFTDLSDKQYALSFHLINIAQPLPAQTFLEMPIQLQEQTSYDFLTDEEDLRIEERVLCEKPYGAFRPLRHLVIYETVHNAGPHTICMGFYRARLSL